MTDLALRYRMSIVWVLCVLYSIYVWRVFELAGR